MAGNTQMTIADYFKRAGIGRDIGRQLQAKSAPGSGNGKHFARLLEGLQSPSPPSDAPSPVGMRIRDYWQRPVTVQTPVREPSAPPTGLTRAPAVAQPVPSEPAPVEPAHQSEAPVAGRLSNETAPTSPPELTPDQLISKSIRTAAVKYRLSPGLIRSVIRAESNFQSDAVSRAGAQGLMQLMPATAEELGVEDAFDIEQNIDGGARYLRRMLDMFDGNLKQALAAYNAGPGTVMRHNGNVPYRETRNYVSKVLAFTKQYAV